MSSLHSTLTPEVERAILSYIRAGGFPSVAAEAAGVSRAAFADWLDRGNRPRAREPYRTFAAAVRQAHAQARLAAELAVHGNRPLDWLRSGPGRPTADQPGWTSAVRAAAATEETLLQRPEVQELIARVMGSLANHPEIAAAVAAQLAGPAAPPTSRHNRS